MNVNPALITSADRQSASLQAEGQGDAVAAHIGGDWAQHTQVMVYAQPYKDSALHISGEYTLRIMATHDASPNPVNEILLVPMVVTGSTPGAVGSPPIIVSQSGRVDAAVGQHAELSITAISGVVVTYQWYRAALLEGNISDIVLAGGVHSKYVFDHVTKENDGQYRCVATNVYGAVASGYTTLIVTG